MNHRAKRSEVLLRSVSQLVNEEEAAKTSVTIGSPRVNSWIRATDVNQQTLISQDETGRQYGSSRRGRRHDSTAFPEELHLNLRKCPDLTTSFTRSAGDVKSKVKTGSNALSTVHMGKLRITPQFTF